MARQVLASAALAAAIGAASLCALVLQLNPGLLLRREASGLVLSLFLPWLLVGTPALLLLALLGSVLRWWPRPFRPVVERRPFFASLSFLALAPVAAVYWQNLLTFRLALPVVSVRALAASAVAVTAAAVVLVAIGLDLALFPRQERPLAGALAILAAAAAVAVPFALRPSAPARQAAPAVRLDAARLARRVVVVGIDGLSPGDLAGEPEKARVPALARLARRGACAPLTTLRPSEGPPLWTTLLTGRLPRDHGVRSAFSYRLLGSRSDWPLLPRGTLVSALERLRLVKRRPVASTARRCRALWNVLDAFGISSGLVRVWGTQPPEEIHGFMISPYFHVLRSNPALAASTLYPRDLLREVSARAVSAADVDPAILRELAEPRPAASPLDDPALRRLAEDALAPDLTYERAADVLRQAYDPSLLVVSFHGYDTAGHLFYRYAHPEAFGNVDPEEARRYGGVLGGYGTLLARWVGEVEKGLRPGDLLVVLSSHGLAPTPLWRRLLGVLTGTETPTTGHEDAPPGVIVMVGDGVRAGTQARDASLLDVMPTLLYLMGLPVARDMEGRVLTELIDPSYAREHALTFIPSYESLAVAPAAAASFQDLPPLPDERP
jgi:predicted AlkP superfamily phosphohydrolase/phosphomutase